MVKKKRDLTYGINFTEIQCKKQDQESLLQSINKIVYEIIICSDFYAFNKALCSQIKENCIKEEIINDLTKNDLTEINNKQMDIHEGHLSELQKLNTNNNDKVQTLFIGIEAKIIFLNEQLHNKEINTSFYYNDFSIELRKNSQSKQPSGVLGIIMVILIVIIFSLLFFVWRRYQKLKEREKHLVANVPQQKMQQQENSEYEELKV
eukprot:TRINITY_DN29843_c0_g1_i1.p2 TRINITY_DN29843_c0_g1~~TRINITY_DN29843_c0_g1_i1.p2  ORF type:complete len:206 (-),score=46.79 TRINITY_DN29843_c0_g1_i1:133-750(-)